MQKEISVKNRIVTLRGHKVGKLTLSRGASGVFFEPNPKYIFSKDDLLKIASVTKK